MTLFRADARCPVCRRDGHVFVESRLGGAGRTYVVGDSTFGDIAPHDFEETSFVVRRPAANEPVHYLSYWSCENCSQASFAEVTFEGDRVEAIESVELSLAGLDRLHYISEDVEDMLRPIVDGSVYTETSLRPDWLDAVKAGLRAGRGYPGPATD